MIYANILFKGHVEGCCPAYWGIARVGSFLGNGIYTKSSAEDRPSSTSVMPIQCKCKILRNYSTV